jgi:tetratricopeptide (TPR) repeat protein
MAFLLASVPARNSELWRHLATGRALLSGSYAFGVDPFAYTTDGTYWVNHNWLYDLVLYLLHAVLGDRLVVANALLAASIAMLLLLGAGWPRHLWRSSFSVVLCLICIAPHLIVSPAMASYLCLAFTLWWLQREQSSASSNQSRVWRNWPLFAVFVVWANCDEWFLLGPLMVGLHWLGSTLGGRRQTTIDGRAFLVSLAVCLLNPHHLWIFRDAAGLLGESQSGNRFGPWSRLLASSWAVPPIPLVATALLALLSCAALLANRRMLHWPSLLLGILLLALSFWQVAALPLFAIVACHVLARNWRSTAPQPEPVRTRFAWLQPLAGIAALLALAASACPGWLQGSPEPRAWHLAPDPSMKRLAEQLATWREQGQFREGNRGFNRSPDMAHYLEWHCPQEKVFLDSRTNLFPANVIADFAQIERVLSVGTTPVSADWEQVRTLLSHWQCSYLLAADPVDRRLATTLRNLWQRPEDWTLAALEGRSALFSLQPSSQLPALNLSQRAFNPPAASCAPGRGLSREPQPRSWWDCFAWSATPGELDRDEAIVDIVHFEATRSLRWPPEAFADMIRSQADRFQADPEKYSADLFLNLLGTIGPRGSGIPIVLPPQQAETRSWLRLFEFWQAPSRGSPGSLHLAVRAARRALHDNPDDALAHLRLGRAYQALHAETIEREIGAALPLLDELRNVQTVVALKRAVRLRPDLLSAHELLADTWLKSRAFDLALPHVQQRLRLSQAAGPLPNELPADFAVRIQRLNDFSEAFGQQVREQLNLVDMQSFDSGVYGKARLAEGHGLPSYALDQLLGSNYAEFGREGALLELYLLLHAGRTEEFRDWIDPKQEAAMGTFNYHWLQTLLNSVDGNYEQASEHLRLLIESNENESKPGDQVWSRRRARAALLGRGLLQIVTQSPSASPESRLYDLVFHRLQGDPRSARQHADLQVLRGLLALEAGEIADARQAFQRALDPHHRDDGSMRLAHYYLELIDENQPRSHK